jgi:hypothetical protein
MGLPAAHLASARALVSSFAEAGAPLRATLCGAEVCSYVYSYVHLFSGQEHPFHPMDSSDTPVLR